MSDGSLIFDTKIDSSGLDKAGSEVSSAFGKLGGFAKKGLDVAVTAVKAAATATVALGGAAVKVGSDFEAGMSKVAAISGATGDDLDALTAKAKEMGAKTKFSASESADAFSYMAMAGWKTEDMLEGIEGIMNLAAASGENLASVSDIVTDDLTAFGLSAKDSGHFADVLAAASSNANTNVALMGETFKYAAPVAGALGYSVEDVAVATGLMANAGIKGSQAGTSLRNVFTRLAKPTKQSADAMDALGISLTDDEGKMKSFGEIVGDMRVSFAGLTEDQKAFYAAELAGQEGMSGLLAIVNASDDDFNKLSDAIQNCDGVTQQMADTMNDNLQGQITILMSGLEGLGISLYEDLQEPMKDAVKTAQGMVQGIQDAFNQGGLKAAVSAAGAAFGDLVVYIAQQIPAVVNAAVDLISAFCDSIKSSAKMLYDTGAAAEIITSLATGILNSIGSIGAAAIEVLRYFIQALADSTPQIVQSAGEMIRTLAEALIENLPAIITAAVEIIIGLVQGIVEQLPMLIDCAIQLIQALADGIIQAIPILVATLPQIISSMITAILEGLPKIIEAGVQILLGLVDAIVQAIPVIVAALPDIINAIVNGLVTALPQIIEAGITLLMGLIDAIPTIITAIVDNLPAIITAIINGLVMALPQIIQAGITLLMGIIKAIPQIIVAIAENLPQIITAIAKGLADAMPQILQSGKELLMMIVKAVPEIVVAIGGAIPDIISGIVKGLLNGISAVKDAALELGRGILGGIKSFFGINSPSTVMAEQGDYLVQGLVNGMAEMPGAIQKTFNETLAKVKAWGAEMLTNATNSITKVVSSVDKLLSELPGKVWKWLVQVVTKATAWGQQMLQTATQAITKMISQIISLMSQLPGKMWTWFTAVVTKTIAWGQQMVSTAKTAISNMISAIIQLMSTLPDKVWTWLVAVVTKVNAWAQQMLNAAKTAISNMISAIVSLLSELPGKVKAKLDEVLSKVTQWGTDMVNKAKEAATGFVNALVNGLSGLPSKMQEIGSNIVQGIWNGISSGWSWLTDKVKSLAQSLLDAAKSALGISSPSKLFAAEVGRWIMPGVIKGIDRTMPSTISDMKDRAGELVASMQGAVSMTAGTLGLNASASAGRLALAGAGTIVYADNSTNITDTFNTPTATPSEIHAAERQAFRNLVRGK